MDVDPDPRLLGPQQAPGDRPRNGAQATHAREGAKDAYRLMEMGGGGKDRSYAVHGNTLVRWRAGGRGEEEEEEEESYCNLLEKPFRPFFCICIFTHIQINICQKCLHFF